jgi:hypothetical protein
VWRLEDAMAKFLSVFVVLCLTVLSQCQVSNAAQVTVDSIIVIHQSSLNRDFIKLTGTWTFTTAGYYGSWAIDDNKTGESIYGNGLASGTHSISQTSQHISGSRQYTGYAGVYYMIGSGTIIVTSAYRTSDTHTP